LKTLGHLRAFDKLFLHVFAYQYQWMELISVRK
jgi:hypothetical protein